MDGAFILGIAITIRGGILQPIRLWLIQNLIEDLLRVKDLGPYILMSILQRLDPLLNLLIEARQRLSLQVDRLLTLTDGEWRPVNRRDIQKNKVLGTAGVKLPNDAEIFVQELVVEVIKVLVPVAVANVINTNPDQEETV